MIIIWEILIQKYMDMKLKSKNKLEFFIILNTNF